MFRKNKQIKYQARDVGKSVSRHPVFSYHKSVDLDKTVTENLDKEIFITPNKLKIIRIIILIIIILGFISIVRISASNPVITYYGNNSSLLAYFEQSDASSLRGYIVNYLNSSFLNQNKISFNEKELSNLILKNYNLINTVNIRTSLFSAQISIFLDLYSPLIDYSNANSGTFLVDQTGQAINNKLPASEISRLNLIKVIDQNAISINNKEYIFTPQEISNIVSINNDLKSNNYIVKYYNLTGEGTELDAIISNKNYYVKFNIFTNNIRLQIGRFLATERYLSANNINPKSYIDVRSEGRVFYQ